MLFTAVNTRYRLDPALLGQGQAAISKLLASACWFALHYQPISTDQLAAIGWASTAAQAQLHQLQGELLAGRLQVIEADHLPRRHRKLAGRPLEPRRRALLLLAIQHVIPFIQTNRGEMEAIDQALQVHRLMVITPH